MKSLFETIPLLRIFFPLLLINNVAAAVDALAVVEAVSGSEAVLRPLH